MTKPPVARPSTKPTIRVVEKKTREFTSARRVRVFNDEGVLIDLCPPDRLRRYLDAPNAELVHSHGGKLIAVKLRSVGDERGHLGEKHGGNSRRTWLGQIDPRLMPGATYGHSRACDQWPRKDRA